MSRTDCSNELDSDGNACVRRVTLWGLCLSDHSRLSRCSLHRAHVLMEISDVFCQPWVRTLHTWLVGFYSFARFLVELLLRDHVDFSNGFAKDFFGRFFEGQRCLTISMVKLVGASGGW